MKQNILIGALVLVAANLLFLNYHFYVERQKAPETVSNLITASDVKDELIALEARLEERLAQKTQVIIPNSVPAQGAGGIGESSRAGLGESYVGVVGLPESLSQLNYRVGGQTAFGITHIFAVKGDECPVGSSPANMPEYQQAREAGFTYCFYWWDYLVFDKKDTDQCPFGMRPVEAERGTSTQEGKFFCRELQGEEAAEFMGDSEQQRVAAEQKAKEEAAAAVKAATEARENADEGEGVDDASQSSGDDMEPTQ